MRATDLQISLPIVDRRQSAVEAGRVIADTGRIGVVVDDGGGSPVGMITATDLLRLALPAYLVNDPSLAATLDDQGCVELILRLSGKSIGEVVDDGSVQLRPVPEVDADASVVEIAAVLVSAGSAIAVVRGNTAHEPRFVTLPIVWEAMLAYADRHPDGGPAGSGAGRRA